MNNNNNCNNNRNKKQNKKRSDKKWQGGKGKHNRKFKKFPDTDYNNYESKSWTEDNWYGDDRNYTCNPNEPAPGSGIFPWIRKKPANPIVFPQHINFEHNEITSNSANNIQHIVSEPKEVIEKALHKDGFHNHDELGDNRKTNNFNPFKDSTLSDFNGVQRSKNNCELSEPPEINHPPESKYPNTSVTIKQEKDPKINIKREKSSSSSSSSSSESSSSEDEPAPINQTAVKVKPEIPDCKPTFPTLDIKLKPRTTSMSSTPVKASQQMKTLAATSSSSSSSSDENSLPPPDKKEKARTSTKSPTVHKPSSEDDVVCVGKVENKFILEDESNSSEEESENEQETILNENTHLKKIKKNKTSERCMICDKRDHTSFQCQMICKNCSAPYHGYRTCPHPANLNTMMQIFIEFCMQQLQNFDAEKYTSTINCDNVPKPKLETPTSFLNKTTNLKRKLKTNSSNKKHKASKKRKLSATKKSKNKASSDESSDNEDEDGSDSTTSSTETNENVSDSSVESLVSSKKKRKIKNKNASKAALDLNNLAANPVNLPIVLNGFPHLNAQASSIQNPTTSANALNTLLLTQMFQNAIGSLKK